MLTKEQEKEIERVMGKNYEFTDIPAKFRINRCLRCQNHFLKKFEEEETCPKCIEEITN